MKPNSNRNLFNADCNTYFYQYADTPSWQRTGRDGRFSAGIIHAYVDMLTANGVDTLVYNPNASRAWWPSKHTPTAWDGYRRGDRSYFEKHFAGEPLTPEQLVDAIDPLVTLLDRYLDLAEDGVDLLAETSKACRRNRIAPWLSVRMNDMHGFHSLEGSFMNSPLLADPRLRLSGRSFLEPHPPQQFRMGLNFAKREVRDYMFTMMQELVNDYDYEGLELDWTRANLCCEPVASAEMIDVITQWHSEIAALCRTRSEAIGRPYYLGLRLPANFAALRHIGLDVRAMIEARFVDFLCPTRAGYSTTWDIAHDAMRDEWGERVAIFGVVENAPNWLPNCGPEGDQRSAKRGSSASAAMLRGNAAGKLVLGADGIETFNFFCTPDPDYTALRDLADLSQLRGKRKFYAFNTGFELGDILTTLEVDEHLPLWMEPNMQRRFRLPMCAEPAGLQVTVQLVFERPAGGGQLPPIGLSFNDAWPSFDSTLSDELLEPTGSLTHHVPENVALNFTLPAASIREGWNDLVVAHGGMAEDLADRRRQGVLLVGIELLVEPAGRPVSTGA